MTVGPLESVGIRVDYLNVSPIHEGEGDRPMMVYRWLLDDKGERVGIRILAAGGRPIDLFEGDVFVFQFSVGLDDGPRLIDQEPVAT